MNRFIIHDFHTTFINHIVLSNRKVSKNDITSATGVSFGCVITSNLIHKFLLAGSDIVFARR